VTPVEFHQGLWQQKTSIPRTPSCDRQTDRQTNTGPQLQSIYRAIIASHGKNARLMSRAETLGI